MLQRSAQLACPRASFSPSSTSLGRSDDLVSDPSPHTAVVMSSVSLGSVRNCAACQEVGGWPGSKRRDYGYSGFQSGSRGVLCMQSGSISRESQRSSEQPRRIVSKSGTQLQVAARIRTGGLRFQPPTGDVY